MLYDVFIADVPEASRRMVSIFAHNTAILSSGLFAAGIIAALIQTNTFLRKRKSLLNSEKTHPIFFTQFTLAHILRIDGNYIPWKNNIGSQA